MKTLKPYLALASAVLLLCIAKVHGLAPAAVLAFILAACFAGTGAMQRGQLGAAPDTIDIASELNLNEILDSAIIAFRRAILPLRVFATVFRNFQLRGTDKIEVPYFPLQGAASKDFTTSYDFSTGAGGKTETRELTINKRKYQPLALTSAQMQRLPQLNAIQFGQMKGEKLAYDAIQDILSVVTAANFPSVAFTGLASTFDSDDVVDIRTACNKNAAPSVTDGATTNASTTITSATAAFTQSDLGIGISGTGIPAGARIASITNATTAVLSAAATATGSGVTFTFTDRPYPWPESGRGLIVNPDYDGALLKDANFRRDLTVAGVGTMQSGQLPRVYGFDYAQTSAIPGNGQNLVGMATFQSAILAAFSPIEPQDEGRIVDYRIQVDPDTGIALEYRKWFDPDSDKVKQVIETNYGFAIGESQAIKRLRSA